MARSLRMHEPDVTLVDLLSNRFAPIQHTLIGFLDAYAEVKLRRVCKALSSFSLDAKDFRSRQAGWNGIIMGNVVLDFFARTENFVLNDPLLILAIPEDQLDYAASYVEDQGYVPLPKNSEIRAKHREYYALCYEQYTHPTRTTHARNRVNVMIVDPSSCSVANSVMWQGFDVTICYNFVTWNKAYSLFPYQTFAQKTGYYTMLMIHNIMSHSAGNQNREIAAAGYDLKDVAWYPEEEKVVLGRRRFGDKHSRIIDLPTEGVTRSLAPDGAIASSTLEVQKYDVDDSTDVEDLECETYWMNFEDSSLTSPVLRHSYMLSYKKGSEYEKKIHMLQRRLNASTAMQISQLPNAQRPNDFDQLHATPGILTTSRFLKKFIIPDWWAYKDSEVVEYLDRLEKECFDGKEA